VVNSRATHVLASVLSAAGQMSCQRDTGSGHARPPPCGLPRGGRGSPVVRPLACSDAIASVKSATRRACLGTICGSASVILSGREAEPSGSPPYTHDLSRQSLWMRQVGGNGLVSGLGATRRREPYMSRAAPRRTVASLLEAAGGDTAPRLWRSQAYNYQASFARGNAIAGWPPSALARSHVNTWGPWHWGGVLPPDLRVQSPNAQIPVWGSRRGDDHKSARRRRDDSLAARAARKPTRAGGTRRALLIWRSSRAGRRSVVTSVKAAVASASKAHQGSLAGVAAEDVRALFAACGVCTPARVVRLPLEA
jgi:hypothetical protein